jgi:hypothetical protein
LPGHRSRGYHSAYLGRADGEELFDKELEADAEHQQDDADFGDLPGERAVRDEAGCVRADQQPGNDVADRR